MNEIKLEKGKALLICGDPGSGKSRRARNIAGAHGSYNEITIGEILRSPFALGGVLKGSPTTVIVHEFEGSEEEIGVAKPLISNEKILVHQMMKPDKTVPLPNFIFVSGCANPIRLHKDDRRFHVLTLHN